MTMGKSKSIVDGVMFLALLMVFSVAPGSSQAQATINAAKDIPALQIKVVSDINQFPSDAAQAAYALRTGRSMLQREPQYDKVIKQLGEKVIELENRIMALERGKQ